MENTELAWGAQEDEQVMSMRATIVALNASLESYQVLSPPDVARQSQKSIPRIYRELTS